MIGSCDVQRCSQRGHSARKMTPRSRASSVRTSLKPQMQQRTRLLKLVPALPIASIAFMDWILLSIFLGSGIRLPEPGSQFGCDVLERGCDVLERRSVTGPVTTLKKTRNGPSAREPRSRASVVRVTGEQRTDGA